jgi:hypothetical protein
VTVAFDNTILSSLLNPKGDVLNDPATGAPLVEAKKRAESVVQIIQKFDLIPENWIVLSWSFSP